MKFSTTTAALAKACNKAATALPTTNTISILNCFHIQADEAGIIVTAQDGELSVSAYADIISCDNKGGKLCVGAGPFLDAVHPLHNTVITIETNGNSLKMSYENGEYNMPLENIDNFPEIERLKEGQVVTYPSDELYNAVATALTHVKTNETLQPVLGCVLLDVQVDGVTTVVASNSTRMYTEIVKGEATYAESRSMLPLKAAKAIASMLKDKQSSTMAIIGDNSITLKTKYDTVTATLLDGRYPNYKRVFPADSTMHAVVNTKELIKAVKITQPFSDVNTAALVLRFYQGILTLTSADEAMDKKAKTQILYHGDADITISLNANALLPLLNSMTTYTNMQFVAPNVAVTLIPEETDSEKRNAKALLMPLCL